MAKIILLIALFSFIALSAQESDIPDDASGNDLNQVIRGFNTKIGAGANYTLGNAGKNVEGTVGSEYRFSMGYDFKMSESTAFGIGVSFGTMMIDTNNREQEIDSVWKEDFAPLMPGAYLSFSYLATERFQINLLAGADYIMKSEVYKKGDEDGIDGETVDSLIAAKGGLGFEYYAYARHFSFGLDATCSYVLDFDGMFVSVLPFVKYTFGN